MLSIIGVFSYQHQQNARSFRIRQHFNRRSKTIWKLTMTVEKLHWTMEGSHDMPFPFLFQLPSSVQVLWFAVNHVIVWTVILRMREALYKRLLRRKWVLWLMFCTLGLWIGTRLMFIVYLFWRQFQTAGLFLQCLSLAPNPSEEPDVYVNTCHVFGATHSPLMAIHGAAEAVQKVNQTWFPLSREVSTLMTITNGRINPPPPPPQSCMLGQNNDCIPLTSLTWRKSSRTWGETEGGLTDFS